MAGELADFARRMNQIADGDVAKRIAAKAGMAAKKSALKAASDSLGGDRAFSGMRRKTRLNAGYDAAGPGQIKVNFRPAGLWKLADKGRRSSGTIRPRSKQAVLTPRGPRRTSSYGRSRGLNTLEDAYDDARRTAPKAAREQFSAEVRKLVK